MSYVTALFFPRLVYRKPTKSNFSWDSLYDGGGEESEKDESERGEIGGKKKQDEEEKLMLNGNV